MHDKKIVIAIIVVVVIAVVLQLVGCYLVFSAVDGLKSIGQ